MTGYAALGALEQGLVFGIMAIGVYLTFRILDFPDLTVDGSLPLGAAIAAVAITAGWPPVLALFCACGAGFVAGAVTAVLNTTFGILHLLASILTMIALYSINIRIMGGPNIALIGARTVFDPLIALGVPGYLGSVVFFGLTAILLIGLLVWFLKTAFGQAMLATGDNPKMIVSQGVDTRFMIIVGVGLSNALVALCGALVAQYQGTADVGMGIGTIVAGLASVIIGETVFGAGTVTRAVIAVVLGSILYRFTIALALSFNVAGFSFSPSDLNLITAVLVVAALIAPQLRQMVKR